MFYYPFETLRFIFLRENEKNRTIDEIPIQSLIVGIKESSISGFSEFDNNR